MHEIGTHNKALKQNHLLTELNYSAMFCTF